MKLILPFLILFQSCATTVMNQEKSRPFVAPDNLSGKNLTIRTYSINQWKGIGTYLRKDENADAAIKELTNDTKFILNFKSLEADSLFFEGEESRKKVSLYLKDEQNKINSDYFLDIFTDSTQEGFHNPVLFLYFLWIGAHIITLGLFPIYTEVQTTQYGHLYNNRGEIIKKSEASTDTTFWTWSPFIFRDDAIKGVDHKALKKNNTEKLMNKVFADKK